MKSRAIAAWVIGLVLVSGLSWNSLVPVGCSHCLPQDDEPRLADGRVDYLAKLNQSLSDGVTPKNNAVVILLEVLGERVLDGIDQEAFLKELGLDQFPSGRPLFVTSSEHAAKLNFSPGSPKHRQWLDTIVQYCDEPWTAEQNPDLASWIEVNEPAIEEVVKASLRPRYFFPLHPLKQNPDAEVNVRMMEVSLDLAQETREVTRHLVIRAMQHLGADDAEAAIRDIQTIRRLALLQTQSSTMIEMLIAIAFDYQAFHGELQLLESGKLTAKQCQAYGRFLKEHPMSLQLPERIETAERYMYLDVVQTLQRGKVPKIELPVDASDLDFTAVEERASNYTAIAETLRESNGLARLEKIQELETELTDEVQRKLHATDIAAAFLNRNVRSRIVGDALFALMMPNGQAMANAEIRLNTTRDLLEIAFAMETYRLATGKFPEALEDLTPEYLKVIPLDRYTDQPLVYRPTAKGYRLYSVGMNQKDDQGQTQRESANADDWGIAIDLRDGD